KELEKRGYLSIYNYPQIEQEGEEEIKGLHLHKIEHYPNLHQADPFFNRLGFLGNSGWLIYNH
ncbi:hypothetical protein, partial [Escherichia coli]|uniref:hypothetical protein n=1 Tax=Escherichia coli TaxID=562 RepID=UPI001BDB7106